MYDGRKRLFSNTRVNTRVNLILNVKTPLGAARCGRSRLRAVHLHVGRFCHPAAEA